MSEEHNDHVTEEEEMEGTFAEMTQPILIDLGKQKRKKLKALKKGKM